MKYAYLPIIIFFSAVVCRGQNLVDNWTFEEDLQLYCEDWYDGCGDELTNNCDTIPECFVAFENESPSIIPEDVWSLRIRAGLGVEGKAETFITGQSGTKVYELSYFMKSPNWNSRVLLGTYSDGKFTDSTTLDTTALQWTSFTLRDTLSTEAEDTIAIRLSAGYGDFCVCLAYFDLIRLQVLDTLTSTDAPHSRERQFTVYPNPAEEYLRIEVDEMGTGPYTIDVYDRRGQAVRRKSAQNPVIDMDISTLPTGLYFFILYSDKHYLGQGKFVVE